MKKFKQRIIDKILKEELSIKNGIVKVDEISCDGCGDCVEHCPFEAIDMITLTDKEVKALPFKGRLKVMIKGNNKAIIN
jgi:ferredoxin